MEEQEAQTKKWHGSVSSIIDAPIEHVWPMMSQTKRLSDWMPTVEVCTTLSGKEETPGYVRLVSGFMFPQDEGQRSWIKERLMSINSTSHSYTYKMEASNVGLDGSQNTLKLSEYGEDSTLVNWSFQIYPVEDSSEELIMDYLGFLYKSCVNRIQTALNLRKTNESDNKSGTRIQIC